MVVGELIVVLFLIVVGLLLCIAAVGMDWRSAFVLGLVTIVIGVSFLVCAILGIDLNDILDKGVANIE